MECVRRDIDCGHLGVGNLDSSRVKIGVDGAFHLEAVACWRAGDELHDGPIADQRLTAPVLRDEREQPVFDLVPFSGTGRQMANRDCQALFIGGVL